MIEKLTSIKTVKALMEANGIEFKKSLGQNFLIDDNIVNKIIEAASLNKEDNILEIGPGIGTMSLPISKDANRFIAIEIDKRFVSILKSVLETNDRIIVINDDFLKIDLKKVEKKFLFNEPYKVISNLPYYVTSPIIIKLLREGNNITSLTLTIQKEVADRLAANPSTKDYGVLTAIARLYCDIKIISSIPSSVFLPKPKVDSALVRMDIIKNDKFKNLKNEDAYIKVVKGAFQFRRKNVANSLSKSLCINRQIIEKILKIERIDPKRRGETFEIKEFIAVTNRLIDSNLV